MKRPPLVSTAESADFARLQARDLMARAMQRHRAGDLTAAAAGYREALTLWPQSFDALRLTGAALHDLGRFSEALPFLDRALALRADFAEAWRHRASASFHLGRFDACVQSYDRVLALADDERGGVHYWRAMALEAMGRADEARAGMQAALDRSLAAVRRLPDEAHVGLSLAGLAMMHLKQHAEALQALDAAIAHAPQWPEAWLNRGTILTEGLERHEDAIVSFDQALALRADFPDCWFNKGIALSKLFRSEEAVACFDRVLAAREDMEALVAHLGCLNALGRPAEVVAAADARLGTDPSLHKLWVVRGWALLLLRQADAAVDSMERARALQPTDYKVVMNSAYAALQCGRHVHGWDLYEKRLEAPDARRTRVADGLRWNGPEDLAGKSILIHAEQGNGDVIQFARFIPAVAALGARVSMEAPLALHPLLRSLEAPVELLAPLAPDDASMRFDYHCPVMSLARAFATRTEYRAAKTPYLHAAAARIEAWRERLARDGGSVPRVGIACSGNPRFGADRLRSIPLAMFAPLLSDDFRFHLLQRDLRPDDERFLRDCGRIADHREQLADFGETAALLQGMDLVISVDTGIAHLAGAMARPLFLLLPEPSEWRWGLDGADTPWYPGATLIRQTRSGDWAGAIERAAVQLRRRLAAPARAVSRVGGTPGNGAEGNDGLPDDAVAGPAVSPLPPTVSPAG